ncbi:MAG: D-alanyl-D-alanine carboxypeptidase/D-alanyl-D-alanine-endopeptidase [Acidimicrobiales bacterium]
MLRARGVLVAGDGASGPAPAGASAVATVTSPPLADVVDRMLLTSDNRIAEQLTKEIGRRTGGGGTTAAGVAAIAARSEELGLTTAATTLLDGSGLHPGNRVTCDGLAAVLHHGGGIEGMVGPGLPVAGKTGTLATRFRGNPAEGRMHAKTGSLNQVSALAGFVALPEGETATFAYVANQAPIDPSVRGVEDVLGAVLGSYVPPCRPSGGAELVAPLAPYASDVGTLSMFPLQSVLLPGAVLPLHVFEDRYRTLVDRCLAADADFGVVLISRGSEVGGADVRTDVGTRARIVQAQQAPDGRWGILALGMERLRVHRWLPDDPHPLADAEDWPDPDPGPDVAGALAGTEARLRRVLALRAELGEPGPSPTVPVEVDDPSLASFHLTALAPLGDLDRHRCLAAAGIADRLARLDELLDEEESVCRARLAGY